MLSVRDLRFQYNHDVKFQFPDFDCALGDTLVISGESGSGKTTLLHILGGLIRPDAGHVFLEDVEMNLLEGSDLDEFRGKSISIIFQKMHFIASISVLENIVLSQWLGTGTRNKEAAMDILEKLGIADQRNKNVSQLSQGQQQRVAIARALINTPRLILADEPTSSLDNKNAEIVEGLLRDSAQALNAALVIVTHDMRMKNHARNLMELV